MSNEKKTKKLFYKRLWFIAIVIIVVIGLIGCGSNDDEKKEESTTIAEVTKEETTVTTTEETTTEETTTEEATTEEATTEEATTETTVSETISEEVVREAIIIMLNEKFESLGEFEYNSELEGFYVTSSDDDFNAALMLVADGNTEMIETWNETIVTAWIEMSNSLKENFPDYNYSIGMMNPFNKENCLLIVKDGVVVYNFSKNVE